MSAELKSSSLTFESGDTSSAAPIGDWGPGKSRMITYRAAFQSDSVVRVYALGLVVNYDDGNGVSRVPDPITTTVESPSE